MLLLPLDSNWNALPLICTFTISDFPFFSFNSIVLLYAKALHDFKIDGKIYTIDRDGNNEKILRSYQLPDDISPKENKISNSEI